MSEFRRGRATVHNRARIEQTFDSRSGVVWTKISIDLRTEGCNLSLNRMKIFNGDWDALKGPRATPHVTSLGGFRLLERAFSECVSKNVEPRIHRLAACEQRLHQFYRRKLFRLELIDRLCRRQITEVQIRRRHRLFLSLRLVEAAAGSFVCVR